MCVVFADPDDTIHPGAAHGHGPALENLFGCRGEGTLPIIARRFGDEHSRKAAHCSSFEVALIGNVAGRDLEAALSEQKTGRLVGDEDPDLPGQRVELAQDGRTGGCIGSDHDQWHALNIVPAPYGGIQTGAAPRFFSYDLQPLQLPYLDSGNSQTMGSVVLDVKDVSEVIARGNS